MWLFSGSEDRNYLDNKLVSLVLEVSTLRGVLGSLGEGEAAGSGGHCSPGSSLEDEAWLELAGTADLDFLGNSSEMQ